MKLLTRQGRANGLVKQFQRWEADRTRDRYIAALCERGLGRPAEELLKLGPNPDPDACDAVLRRELDQHTWPSGNTPTWTTLTCGECGCVSDALVVLGESDEYDSANVCRACLVKAIAMLDEAATKGLT